MFEQKNLFYKLFSGFQIMGAIKDVNIKIWTYKYLSLKAKYQKSGWLPWKVIYGGNMPANFQISSSTSVGGEWGGIKKGVRHAIICPITV